MRFRTSTAAALSLLLAVAPALAQTAPQAGTPPPASPPPASPRAAPDASPASDAKPADAKPAADARPGAGTPPSRNRTGTRKKAKKTKGARKKTKKGKKGAAPAAAVAPASPTGATPRAQAEEEFAAGPQDDESPAIVHTPVGTAQRGKPLVVAARIADASGVFQALVHLRKHGPGDYIPLKMAAAKAKKGDYAIEIPEKLLSVDLDYFIEAYDNAGNRATVGTPDRPMVIKLVDAKKQDLVITGGPKGGSLPSITLAPVARATRGQSIEIAARVVGDNGVSGPAVLFRHLGDQEYRSLPMGDLGDGRYTATMPAAVVTSDIEYYLEAFDKEGNGPSRSGGPIAPYRVTVSDAGAAVVTRVPGEAQMGKAPFSPNPGRALGWVFMAGFVGAGVFAGGEAYGAWQANQNYRHTFDYEGRLVPGLNDRANQYADRAKKLAIVSGASLLVGIVLLVAFPEHPDRIAPAGADGVAVRF
jgi:hypothetical protein